MLADPASSATVTSSMLKAGTSLSVMVAVASPSAMVAPSASPNATVKASMGSTSVSSRIGTVIVAATEPAAMVSVPAVACVVRTLGGGAVGGGVADGHRLGARLVEGHGDARRPGVLRDRGVVDAQSRHVVVGDGGGGFAVGDGRAAGIAQRDGEGLDGFVERVV